MLISKSKMQVTPWVCIDLYDLLYSIPTEKREQEDILKHTKHVKYTTSEKQYKFEEHIVKTDFSNKGINSLLISNFEIQISRCICSTFCILRRSLASLQLIIGSKSPDVGVFE